jgi:hypothetical protein
MLVTKFKKIALIGLRGVRNTPDDHTLCLNTLQIVTLNTVHAAVELNEIYCNPQEKNY